MLIDQVAVPRIKAFVADEEGVTAVEYGLLAALIAVVAIAAFSLTGTRLTELYEYWTSEVGRAIASSLP